MLVVACSASTAQQHTNHAALACPFNPGTGLLPQFARPPSKFNCKMHSSTGDWLKDVRHIQIDSTIDTSHYIRGGVHLLYLRSCAFEYRYIL
jgi:hypothetical protein